MFADTVLNHHIAARSMLAFALLFAVALLCGCAGYGKLQRIDNVMKPRTFADIRATMSKAQVLHILGPPEPSWTVYFKARDELVWEWRYCDDWNEPARFGALFDGTTGQVRSTMSLRESQMGLCGTDGGCTCAR